MHRMERIEPVGSHQKSGPTKLEPWQGTVVDPTLAAWLEERRWLHQAADYLDTTVAALDGAGHDLAILLYVRHRAQISGALHSAVAARCRLRSMGAKLDGSDGSRQEAWTTMDIAEKEGGLQALGEFRGSLSLHLASHLAQLRHRNTQLAAMRTTRNSVRSWLQSLDHSINVRARVHAFNHLDFDEAAKSAEVLVVARGERPAEVNIIVSLQRPV